MVASLAGILFEQNTVDRIWFLPCRLQELGFEKGWGNTAGRVLQTIKMLEDLLQAPDPDTLEKFLARIPMVFSVCIVSPHGYFGQAGVLGLPDTGGQVYWSILHEELIFFSTILVSA